MHAPLRPFLPFLILAGLTSEAAAQCDACEEHQVHVIGPGDKRQKTMRIAHDGSALKKLMDKLSDLAGGEPERVGAAIERKSGPLVEALLDQGFCVFSINP